MGSLLWNNYVSCFLHMLPAHASWKGAGKFPACGLTFSRLSSSHVTCRKHASCKNAGKFSYKMSPQYKFELYRLHCELYCLEHMPETFSHMCRRSFGTWWINLDFLVKCMHPHTRTQSHTSHTPSHTHAPPHTHTHFTHMHPHTHIAREPIRFGATLQKR